MPAEHLTQTSRLIRCEQNIVNLAKLAHRIISCYVVPYSVRKVNSLQSLFTLSLFIGHLGCTGTAQSLLLVTATKFSTVLLIFKNSGVMNENCIGGSNLLFRNSRHIRTIQLCDHWEDQCSHGSTCKFTSENISLLVVAEKAWEY